MGRYIGARYVPIQAGAWDNTREYEPLTVVQYQGDSYTSKTYVPVGAAITNTTYWVKTSEFSQQVANLAQSVSQLESNKADKNGFVCETLIKTTSSTAPGAVAYPADDSDLIQTAKAGYTPIGIVGFQVDPPACKINQLTILADRNNNIGWALQNTGDSASALTVAVQVLYLRD